MKEDLAPWTRATETAEVGAALRAWKHVSGLNVTTKV